MKFLLIVHLLVLITCAKVNFCYAQNLIISKDTAKVSLDVTGNFNGAEVYLPSIKKKPDFIGGRKAWQTFLINNFDISVPFANRVFPGTY